MCEDVNASAATDGYRPSPWRWRYDALVASDETEVIGCAIDDDGDSRIFAADEKHATLVENASELLEALVAIRDDQELHLDWSIDDWTRDSIRVASRVLAKFGR